MARTQQTFDNDKDSPIYISVEIWPECFELEPGEKLTLIWDAADHRDAVQVNVINERELVVWPKPVHFALPIESLQPFRPVAP